MFRMSSQANLHGEARSCQILTCDEKQIGEDVNLKFGAHEKSVRKNICQSVDSAISFRQRQHSTL